jgi:hypothetical protein
MLGTSRRGFLLGAAASVTTAWTVPGAATLMRALPLSLLVRRSEHVLVIEPVEAVCRHVTSGGRRSIVTDTRVLVHDSWQQATEPELMLRTLENIVDGVGELVHGQPLLLLGERGVAFLKRGRDAAWWTTGMAQGHYPLSGAGERARLLQNRGMPELLRGAGSAVERLVGRELSDARELVRQARHP